MQHTIRQIKTKVTNFQSAFPHGKRQHDTKETRAQNTSLSQAVENVKFSASASRSDDPARLPIVYFQNHPHHMF